MRTDRDLLELAAKAAGVKAEWVDTPHEQCFKVPYQSTDGLIGGWKVWNALTDDGDALRLAVKLRLDFAFVGTTLVEVCWFDQSAFTTRFAEESINDAQGEREATRRAIVRAAAEIAVRAHPDHKDGGANG